jgi:hypothetical protein
MLVIEKSQTVKAIYCIISTMWLSGKSKTMETVKRWKVVRDQKAGRGKSGECKGFLKQQSHSVWYYNDRDVS